MKASAPGGDLGHLAQAHAPAAVGAWRAGRRPPGCQKPRVLARAGVKAFLMPTQNGTLAWAQRSATCSLPASTRRPGTTAGPRPQTGRAPLHHGVPHRGRIEAVQFLPQHSRRQHQQGMGRNRSRALGEVEAMGIPVASAPRHRDRRRPAARCGASPFPRPPLADPRACRTKPRPRAWGLRRRVSFLENPPTVTPISSDSLGAVGHARLNLRFLCSQSAGWLKRTEIVNSNKLKTLASSGLAVVAMAPVGRGDLHDPGGRAGGRPLAAAAR